MEYHTKTVLENDEKQKPNVDKVRAEIDTKVQELNQKLPVMEDRHKDSGVKSKTACYGKT